MMFPISASSLVSGPNLRLILAQFLVIITGPLGAQTPTLLSDVPAISHSVPTVSNHPPVLRIVVPTAADTHLPNLTRIVQIRELSPREASRGYPVRVTGVVTYYDPVDYKHFVQDDSAGIYFALSTTNLDALLDHGQKVEIEGFSGPGDYAPIIYATGIRVLGTSPFPQAKASMAQLWTTGSDDSQWVALRGVIRSQGVENDRSVLMLWTGEATIKITVPHAAKVPAPINFVDAALEVHGVCSTLFSKLRRLQSVELHTPDWRQFEVQETGPQDPFSLPVQAISELLEFHSGLSGIHRSRITGIVTLRQSDGSFFVQDASGGVLVRPGDSPSKIQAGSPAEIVGFTTVIDRLPVLLNAIAKPLNQLPPVRPVILTPESPLNEALHATLVQLEARVIAHSTRPLEEILRVEFSQSVTDAILESKTANLQFAPFVPGSIVGLTGVYIAQLDFSGRIRSFSLRLRSPNDIVLISRPPWWTVTHTLWVLGGLAAVLSGSLVWVNLLQGQVRRRTLALSEEVEEHKNTEAQLKQQTGIIVAEIEQRKRAQAELENKQAALENEIGERMKAERQLIEKHKQLVEISRQAGMAEVAIDVLHNIGNVLNSVNVAATIVSDQVRQSKLANLAKVCDLLRQHESDLAGFLTSDARGQQVPGYLSTLADHLASEQSEMLAELSSLQKNIDHIKDIVAMQQNYAKVSGAFERLKVTDLVEDALRMNGGALARHGVEVILEYGPHLPEISIDKNKVIQILVNLIRNAKYACDESCRPDKEIKLHITEAGGRVSIAVIDNGVGISPENLTRIFAHGFTTRKNGHGFGLHSAALAAKDLGGTLTAVSNGPGSGARFLLELPNSPESPPA